MKVLLVGATRATGLAIIGQALDRGIDVTAAVRSPHKLGALTEQIHVCTGDVFSGKLIADAATGADAVLSSLGAPEGSSL